ncbi:3-oxoacyl-ACP reductase [Paenibacillus ferrarius]|uniref:3-oxoacyl-ACP reductase n=1 Tax=Paenibacillus ferrarius TaxID=1469647 RepID=A0A1V4H9M6_9BACL|nr:3-oxoacyl-ACP reductase FabG [Paenibacillus ferrarius]OPH47810.1 3-oxoacyl-ACP reductase [Paenibacillus ferrarius]
MDNSFKNKSVIVTGSSKGIGKGIAKVFAKKGAKVAIVSRNLDEAEICAAEIRASGGYAQGFRGDVMDLSSMEIMAHSVSKAFDGIDVLCANAGIGPMATIEKMVAEEWDRMMNTNVRGALFSLQACLPFLREAEYGRVVLTSSITGPVTGFVGWSHYGASKAAQLGFIRSAALELAPFGITINAIMPGNTMTEQIQTSPEYIETMLPAIPLKRFGTPEEMGHAAAFLASKEAGFITGQAIIIDGGQSLPESSLV